MSNQHAVIYDRASTQRQENNWSREDALRVGKILAEKHGYIWELRQEIQSGESLTNRPVMRGILDDIEAGKIHAIICQDLIRLSRDEDTIDGLVIREVCRRFNVLVITQNKIYDFNRETDDNAADIEFLMAKWQKKASNRQVIRGMKEKARQGGFNGGKPPLGYQLVYTQPNKPGQKPSADLAIDDNEKGLAKLIFELFIELETAGGVSKRLNEMGYRGKNGSHFSPSTIIRTIQKPIYAGFMTWGIRKKSRYLRNFEQPYTYRPELQIVSTDVWEKANELMDRRSKPKKRQGEYGTHLFTGFLTCENCRGGVIGYLHKKRDRVVYRCRDSAFYGKIKCEHGKNYNEHLVVQAVIPFMAQLIRDQIGLTDALNQAADQYGKTFTEAELEETIKAELSKIRKAKKRVVESIAEGILTPNEAKETLAELRDQESRLQRDLATIGEKAIIRSDYLNALEALKNKDIEQTLWTMSQTSKRSFRKLLRMIFEPNSIKVRTERIPGSKKWRGVLEEYRLTESFLEVYGGDTLELVSYSHRRADVYPVIESLGVGVAEDDAAVGDSLAQETVPQGVASVTHRGQGVKSILQRA